MLESVLVGMIVTVAVVYAVWALTPAHTRRRLAMQWAHALGGPAAPGVSGRVARRLQKIAKVSPGGCGECPAATLTPAERKPGDAER